MKKSTVLKQFFAMLFLVSITSLDFATGLPKTISISPQEQDEILQHPKIQYIYLGQELSNIADMMQKLVTLDDKKSIVHELHNYLKEGYKIARRETVLDALDYAFRILRDSRQGKNIAVELKKNRKKIEDDELNIDMAIGDSTESDSGYIAAKESKDDKDRPVASSQQETPADTDQEDVTRDPEVNVVEGCLEVTNDALVERNVTVGNDLVVKNNTTVRNDLTVRNLFNVCGKARFEKDTKFKKKCRNCQKFNR